MSTTIEFGCPACGRAVECAPGETVPCRRCGADATLAESEAELTQCLACGCEHLYRHRDFNQKLGIAIIAIGAGLCFVWPYWPLGLAAVVDLVLYNTLPDVAICYRCKAHHRGFDNIGAITAFDLERHEHYRFKKARDEGRIDPPTRPEELKPD